MDGEWGARVIASTTPVMDTEQTYEEEWHTLVRQGGLAAKVPSHSIILGRVVVVHTQVFNVRLLSTQAHGHLHSILDHDIDILVLA